MKKDVLDYDPDLAFPLIAKHEGCRLDAYYCPAGILSIGYGHTANVYPDMHITREEAEAMLHDDLPKYQDDLAKLVTARVTQGQFIALMSFVYNFGAAKCRTYSLFKELNRGHYEAAAEWFPKYVYSAGQKLRGLVARREEERKVFLTGC
jgi:GH24 family phage-related lysozyme (muramidase)